MSLSIDSTESPKCLTESDPNHYVQTVNKLKMSLNYPEKGRLRGSNISAAGFKNSVLTCGSQRVMKSSQEKSTAVQEMVISLDPSEVKSGIAFTQSVD